jgi:hypothetical protein
MKKPSLRQQIAKYLYDRYEPPIRAFGVAIENAPPWLEATAAKHHEWTEVADWCIRTVRKHDEATQKKARIEATRHILDAKEILARRMQEL